MTPERTFRSRHAVLHDRGMVVHDFLGSYHPGEERHFFTLSRKEKATLVAKGEAKRWSEALTSLFRSWDEIPQSKEAERGDLILYRYKNEIPNIHHLYFPAGVPIFDILAYPDKIDSVQKDQGKIKSVTVTETHFTSFRNPMETYSAFKESLSQMRKVGYLKDEKVVIQAPDFLLFDDINNFLGEKFKLQLPKMRQEMEFFRSQL